MPYAISTTGNIFGFTATTYVPVAMSASASGLNASTSGWMRAVGTFGTRIAAAYTWTAGSGGWSTATNWNYGNFPPASYDSILMTNGGTIDLGGAQSVVNVGAAGNGIVGTLTDGSLAFTGDMYVASGTVGVNLSNSGGSGRLWIGGNSGATVYLNGTNDVTYSDGQATIIGHSTTGAAGTVVLNNPNALNGAGQDTQVFSGTLDLNGQASVRANNIKLLSGGSSALVSNAGAASTSANVALTDGALLGGAGNLTLGGVLSDSSGAAGFTKIGAGTLTLSAADTYSGNTTISQGTLRLGALEVIPDGPGKGNVALSGGTLDLGGYSETINGLSGSGTVDNTWTSATLTVGNNNASSTFGGVIQNTANPLTLIKIGSGTLILSGSSTYSGGTTISQGTLQLGDGSSSNGSVSGNITDNATLAFANPNAQTYSAIISGTAL